MEWSNDLYLEISNNCTIKFHPNNTSSLDAFSLDEDSWITLSKRCERNWSEGLKEWETVLLINGSYAKSAADNLRSSDLSQKQHLKVAVLLSYAPKQDLKVAEFCSSLVAKELKEQCFSYKYQRMTHFLNSKKINSLSFWYYLGRNGSHISSDQQVVANASKNAVLDKITADMLNEKYSSDICTQFISLKKEIKCFYIPMITSDYFMNNYSLNTLNEYFRRQHDVVCFTLNQIYLLMKTHEKLDTTDALQIRVWSQEYHETRDEEILCAEVKQAFLKHNIPAKTQNTYLDLLDGHLFGS
jgi:hypothetical protein